MSRWPLILKSSHKVGALDGLKFSPLIGVNALFC